MAVQVLWLISLSAWHGPVTLSRCSPSGVGRASIMRSTLTTYSTVDFQAREATLAIGGQQPAIVDDRAAVPAILRAASVIVRLMTMWPRLATALATALAASMVSVRLRTRLYPGSALLTSLLLCEAAHYCHATFASHARGRSHTRPDRSGATQLELWRKCLEEDTTVSAASLICGWFLPSQPVEGAEKARTVPRLDELHRENVEEFLAYALQSARVDELDSVGRAELEASVRMTEERIATEEALPGFRFEAGYNPQLSAMTLNLDPPSSTMQPRPLLYYMLTDFLRRVTGTVMRWRGFRRYREGHLSYWHHAGEGAGAEATPLVFVHGVGLGLTPYLGWLRHLRALGGGQRPPMLVLELPFVSQRLDGLRSLPQEKRTTHEIGRAMARHQLRNATFIGHSLGTVYLSWIAKLRPDLLASCVFIDPIVFLLHQRKVRRHRPMRAFWSPLIPSHPLTFPHVPSRPLTPPHIVAFRSRTRSSTTSPRVTTRRRR